MDELAQAHSSSFISNIIIGAKPKPCNKKKRLIKWNAARFTRTGLQMFLVFLKRSEVSRLQSALVSDFWSGEPASRSFKEVVIVLIIKNENGV